jgi:hypothetical protein
MKTASFPAVVEARKAATGQLAFYKSMMASSGKQAKPSNSSTSGSAKKEGSKKPSGK